MLQIKGVTLDIDGIKLHINVQSNTIKLHLHLYGSLELYTLDLTLGT